MLRQHGHLVGMYSKDVACSHRAGPCEGYRARWSRIVRNLNLSLYQQARTASTAFLPNVSACEEACNCALW